MYFRGMVNFEANIWSWNGSKFSSDGLLIMRLKLCDIVIHGVMPSAIEIKRFHQLKELTVVMILFKNECIDVNSKIYC